MATVEYVVTAGRLNFRSSADSSSDANILATLPRGYLLHGEAAPVGGEWLKVSAILPSWPEEAEGFVSARYAVETQDAAAATVAAGATDAAAPAGANVPALAPQPASAFRITLAELQDLAPNGKAAFMEPLVQNCVAVREHYGLAVTPLHMCHFLAQLAHECAGFRTMREFWGPTNAQKRYEGRADLGNDQPGDGKRFMGRGYIQITGRANYGTYGSKLGLGLTANPALAEDPLTALNIACIYWKKRNIDSPAGTNDIGEVTRRINGGTNGLADRTALFRKARKLWP